MKFIQERGSWEIVKKTVDQAVDHLKSQGITQFGVIGVCWAGKMASDSFNLKSFFLSYYLIPLYLFVIY